MVTRTSRSTQSRRPSWGHMRSQAYNGKKDLHDSRRTYVGADSRENRQFKTITCPTYPNTEHADDGTILQSMQPCVRLREHHKAGSCMRKSTGDKSSSGMFLTKRQTNLVQDEARHIDTASTRKMQGRHPDRLRRHSLIRRSGYPA